MRSYCLSLFTFKKSRGRRPHQLHTTTRDLKYWSLGDFVIVGKNETKLFKHFSTKESHDPIFGPCLAAFYKSECGKFVVKIDVVGDVI